MLVKIRCLAFDLIITVLAFIITIVANTSTEVYHFTGLVLDTKLVIDNLMKLVMDNKPKCHG